MYTLWHLGLAVPDLESATQELTALWGLQWRPSVTRSIPVDVGGDSRTLDVTVTFSRGGPFAVEVWQGIEGTPLAVPDHGWVHHLGYWVEDHAAERARLTEAGYPAFLTSEPTLALHRGPGGLGLEPCDLQRDQPYLRDLFPVTSPHHGEPVLPGSRDERGVGA